MSRVTKNVRLLQQVDRWMGAPLCLVLTAYRRVRSWLWVADRRAPQRIIFIKLAEQGSTVLAYDAISRAVARVGREHVFFLVFEENRFILDALDLIPRENVLTVQTRSAVATAVSGLARLLEIRRRRIDTCVDLEFLSRLSAAIAFLTGCRTRLGLHSYFNEGPYRGDLFTHRVQYNPHLHTSRLFTMLVMAIDARADALPALDITPPESPPPPRLAAAADEYAQVRATLDELGVSRGDRLVLLNPNASDQLPLRRWDPANYLALASRLLAWRPDITVALTGAPDEAEAVSALARQVASPRCVSMAGRTTLRQLLVLYDSADVLVTNDSGPGHFSALTGVDAIVLFGPETPLLFAALGERTHPLWAGIGCSPCVNAYNNRQTSCRDNRCMQAITVDDVFGATTRILDARLERRGAGVISPPASGALREPARIPGRS